MVDEEMYLVWSNEHEGWWGPGECGYTKCLSRAGTYTRSQALAICGRALPNAIREETFSELPVRLSDVRDMISRSEWSSYFLMNIGGSQ